MAGSICTQRCRFASPLQAKYFPQFSSQWNFGGLGGDSSSVFGEAEVAAFRDISQNDGDMLDCLTALFIVALGMLKLAVLTGWAGSDDGERRAGTGKVGGKEA
jgi:hypothetical protein